MARKKRKKVSLHDQIYVNLTKKFNEGKGRSRNEDKKQGITDKYIYSHNTYHTYVNECNKFCNWCKSKYGDTSIYECKHHITDYLQSLINDNRSAWTISTSASAIAKLYGIKTTDINIELPSRKRQDIKRSRLDVEYDRHISATNKAYYDAFNRCCGLRIRELLNVKGTDLIYKDDSYYINVVNGKGGKTRQAKIIGSNEEITKVVQMFKDASTNKVFASIPKAYDCHNARAEYATRYYHMIARPIEDIPKGEKYYCRNDLKGVVYDRKAMKTVSESLGHNRIDVIAYNYLRY